MRLIFSILLLTTIAVAQPPTTPGGSQPKQPSEPFFKKQEKKKDNVRTLTGVVRMPDNAAAGGAVVKLNNQRTGETRAFITQTDGKYRFDELDRETIFNITAEFKNYKSKTRSLTPFDARLAPNMDLQLEQVAATPPAKAPEGKDAPKK